VEKGAAMPRRKRTKREADPRLVAKIKGSGLSYGDVARLAKASWSMVDKVVHREKQSARLRAIILALPPKSNGTGHVVAERRRRRT
jgi:hypothetical protein